MWGYQVYELCDNVLKFEIMIYCDMPSVPGGSPCRFADRCSLERRVAF